ncbi:MAG: cytochrome b [Rhodospirillaceae bacterium]|nr:MAG: cytochrome b [Rhodospirillaceae bacterium]
MRVVEGFTQVVLCSGGFSARRLLLRSQEFIAPLDNTRNGHMDWLAILLGYTVGGHMTERRSIDSYNRAARLFHWSIAALMAGMYLTDWTRSALERNSPERSFVLATHMSLGVLVFILTLVRVVWRLRRGAPAPLPAPGLFRLGSKLGHVALYLATLFLPVTGALRALAGGKQIYFFGLPLVGPLDRDEAVLGATQVLHGDLLMNLLLALIGVHVLAALWHHFVLKDHTLRRMV